MLILIFVGIAAGFISGLTGLGGGILLLTALGQFLPGNALIPIHGFIQLLSNTSRVALGFSYLNKRIIFSFSLGALGGSLLGLVIIPHFSTQWLSVSIGLYLLITLWTPLIKKISHSISLAYPVLGFLSSFLSLFIGLSGPLIHPVLAHDKAIKKENFIPTEAACAGFVHLLKMFVYIYGGFSLRQYFDITLYVSASTLFGVYLGHKFLRRLPEKTFLVLIKIIVSLLALRMIWLAFR